MLYDDDDDDELLKAFGKSPKKLTPTGLPVSYLNEMYHVQKNSNNIVFQSKADHPRT